MLPTLWKVDPLLDPSYRWHGASIAMVDVVVSNEQKEQQMSLAETVQLTSVDIS